MDITRPATGYADELADALTELFGGFPISGADVRHAVQLVDDRADAEEIDRRKLAARLNGALAALAAARGGLRRMNADPLFDLGHDKDIGGLLDDAGRGVRAALALLEQADRLFPDAGGAPLYDVDQDPGALG